MKPGARTKSAYTWEELESNGIEVIDDDPVSDVDASLLSGTTEEGADDFDDDED